MKTLVLYVFHQWSEYVNFFMERGVYEDPDVTFRIIINDLNFDVSQIPSYCQILKRDNQYQDFGGWSDGLKMGYTEFDNFIFINASCVGPFIHPNITEKWTTIFLRGLDRPNVKLFGSTINLINRSDNRLATVQSWAFCCRKETVELLIRERIFDWFEYDQMNTKDELIWCHEVRMSTVVRQNGGNIGSMMQLYSGVDFLQPINYPTNNWDVAYPGRYMGGTLHPYEVMFIKTNRGYDPNWLKFYMN